MSSLSRSVSKNLASFTQSNSTNLLSKGYVAKVQKKDSARGGSARPDFVKRSQGCCFQLLSFLHLPGGYQHKKFVDCSETDATTWSNTSSLSTKSHESQTSSQYSALRKSTTPNPVDEVNADSQPLVPVNPKKLNPRRSSSTLITYGTKKESFFALKSIILDRCSSAHFKEELKNEGTFVRNL